MTTLVDASTSATTFATEPLFAVIAVVAFTVLIFLSIKGKLRDWFLH